MVDFNKISSNKDNELPQEPEKIFRRLPKTGNINDLYASQASVLTTWYETRNDRQDHIIKLHTGGGKTLVGLLIAQSLINEHKQSILYLAATRQLVSQTLAKANEYNINAIEYDSDKPMDELLEGNIIIVCTYQALFNGKSRFGVRGRGTRNIQKVAGIILDDAHTSFSTLRDCFSIRIEKTTDTEIYKHVTNTFRATFEEIGKIGAFDDMIFNDDLITLEVPLLGLDQKK